MGKRKRTKEEIIRERFLGYVDKIVQTRMKKGKDYGDGEDSLSNLRECARIGISPVVGVHVRMEDKMARIRSFINKGELVNEPVRDSYLDIAVYAILAQILLDEQEEDNV